MPSEKATGASFLACGIAVLTLAGGLIGTGVVRTDGPRSAIAAAVCRMPHLPTTPPVQSQQAADLMGVPHCDGALTAWAVRAGGPRVLFAFAVDPEVAGGGFAPGCRAQPSRGYLGLRRSDGKLALLGRVLTPDGPAVVARGRVAVVGYRRACRGQSAQPQQAAPLERLRLLRGAVGTLPRSGLALSEHAEPGSSAIAADRAGGLAVAWLEPHRPTHGSVLDLADRLYVSVGRIDGPMSRPRMLAGRSAVRTVRLAWASNRHLQVIYEASVGRRQRLEVSEWHPGQVFTSPQAIGPAHNNVQLSVAVGLNGRVAVAWGTERAGIESGESWRVFAAVRPHAGARFGPARLLDPGRIYVAPPDDVSTRIGADGITTVAWSSAQASDPTTGQDPVKAVTISPTGRFGAVQTLAPASLGVTLTENENAQTILQWRTPSGLKQAIRAPRASSFGPTTPAPTSAREIYQTPLIQSDTGS
jgi:hypothetical protein